MNFKDIIEAGVCRFQSLSKITLKNLDDFCCLGFALIKKKFLELHF